MAIFLSADITLQANNKSTPGTGPMEIKKCCITNITGFRNTLDNPFPADLVVLPQVLGNGPTLLRHNEIEVRLEQLQAVPEIFVKRKY